MVSLFANLDSQRLARVSGTVLLAVREKGVRSVALTSADEQLDLSVLADTLMENLRASDPELDLAFRLAPGLLSTAEGAVKVRGADASLLVVRAGHCHLGPVRQATEHLLASKTPLLGIILAETRNPVPRILRRVFGVS